VEAGVGVRVLALDLERTLISDAMSAEPRPGLFAFLAFLGFVAVLVGYTGRAAWRSGPQGERRLLLAGLGSALVVYLVSSAVEWHWYLPASTLFFFVLAAIAVKFASREDWGTAEAPPTGDGADRPTLHAP